HRVARPERARAGSGRRRGGDQPWSVAAGRRRLPARRMAFRDEGDVGRRQAHRGVGAADADGGQGGADRGSAATHVRTHPAGQTARGRAQASRGVDHLALPQGVAGRRRRVVRAAQDSGRSGAAGTARSGHRRGRGRRHRQGGSGQAGGPLSMWDPGKYLGYADERARPFAELLNRVDADKPRRVVDLGCGPGHLTVRLIERWPDAQVEALDSSPEMVAAARANGIDARVQDVRDWVPPADADVVVCNAVLQWVPGHEELLPRWAEALPPGAWLAVQVPGHQRSPSHQLVREFVADPRWGLDG